MEKKKSKIKEAKKTWVKWKEKCISVLRNESSLKTGTRARKRNRKDITNGSQSSHLERNKGQVQLWKDKTI